MIITMTLCCRPCDRSVYCECVNVCGALRVYHWHCVIIQVSNRSENSYARKWRRSPHTHTCRYAKPVYIVHVGMCTTRNRAYKSGDSDNCTLWNVHTSLSPEYANAFSVSLITNKRIGIIIQIVCQTGLCQRPIDNTWWCEQNGNEIVRQ